MSEENTNNPTPSSSPSPAPQDDPNSVDLTLNDLAALKSIVDVASSRGAFKPNEMVTVGSVYAKLEKFLDLAAKQSQAAQAQSQAQQNQATPNA